MSLGIAVCYTYAQLFEKLFFWRKSCAQGRRGQKQFMKSTPVPHVLKPVAKRSCLVRDRCPCPKQLICPVFRFHLTLWEIQRLKCLAVEAGRLAKTNLTSAFFWFFFLFFIWLWMAFQCISFESSFFFLSPDSSLWVERKNENIFCYSLDLQNGDTYHTQGETKMMKFWKTVVYVKIKDVKIK